MAVRFFMVLRLPVGPGLCKADPDDWQEMLKGMRFRYVRPRVSSVFLPGYFCAMKRLFPSFPRGQALGCYRIGCREPWQPFFCARAALRGRIPADVAAVFAIAKTGIGFDLFIWWGKIC